MKEGLQSGKDIHFKKPQCDFCHPDQSNHFQHFKKFGISDRLDLVPLFITDHARIVPDMLPVHPQGHHVVLIPEEHTLSFANPSIHAINENIGELIHTVENAFNSEVVLFEHGGVSELGSSHQSKTHAHMHIIGNEKGLDIITYMKDILRKKSIDYKQVSVSDISPIENLKAIFKNTGYIYIQQQNTAIIAHDYQHNFPSLISQGSMSQLLSGQELNWKKILTDNQDFAKMSVSRIMDLRNICQI